MNASRVVWLGVSYERNRWKFEHVIRNSCWQPSVSEDNGNLHLRSKITSSCTAGCGCEAQCGSCRLESLSPASPLHLPLALPLQLGLFDAGLDSRSPECTVGCCWLKVSRADVAGLQVTLADILVAQSWSSCWPRPCGELTVHDVLWDASIIHSAYMAKPTQSPLGQHGIHAR